MTTENPLAASLLDAIIDTLDIPKSYYEKAAARHKSLGDWLCRPDSRVAQYQPRVSLQGSFRYGTVIRPLLAGARYDLDNVTTLEISKTTMKQKDVKHIYGAEIKAYAVAHNMLEPVEEKDRCWRLNYSDEVNFHLDTLPGLPDDPAMIQAIVARGVPLLLASEAIAITDRRHPQYDQVTGAWPSSNPRGFAKWFEARTRPFALAKMSRLVEARLYASVDDVPPYEWKTPLQRCIQLLKRHRDVMFKEEPAKAPISMIITNLATHAYDGETDMWQAMINILERMPGFVRPTHPRVPNPADPAEDYADKWAQNPTLENHFWAWHAQAKADVTRITGALRSPRLAGEVRTALGVDLAADQLRALESPVNPPTIPPRPAPVVQIAGAARPWRDRA